jgi:hypothetical protein
MELWIMQHVMDYQSPNNFEQQNNELQKVA